MSEVILPAEEGKTTIALGIEYDGSRYYGWQRQSEVASVQGCLEKALSKVAAEPVSVFCVAGPMPGCMPPARWCIFIRQLSVKMPPGRWA